MSAASLQCAQSAEAQAYEHEVADEVLRAYIAAGCVSFEPWTASPTESEKTPPIAELAVHESQLLAPSNRDHLEVVARAIAHHPCAAHIDALTYTRDLKPLAQRVARARHLPIVHVTHCVGSDVPVLVGDGRTRAQKAELPMVLVGANATPNAIQASRDLFRTSSGLVHVMAGIARGSAGGGERADRGNALSQLPLLTTRLGLWVRTGYWAEDGRVERP